jgi:hypothetical protein
MKLNSNNPNVKQTFIEITSLVVFDEDGFPIDWSSKLHLKSYNISSTQLTRTLAAIVHTVTLDASEGDEKYFQSMMKKIINMLIAFNNTGIDAKTAKLLSSLIK